MLCERCHKNLSTLRYTEVVNGKAFVRNICNGCLDDLQDSAATGFEVSGSAPAAKNHEAYDIELESLTLHEACTSCAMPLSDVLKIGRLGCPQCYVQFGARIEPLLSDKHPALRHRGKAPHVDDARTRLRSELQAKRALLRSALKTESYEEAAQLRDAIRSLETSVGSVDG
jgi:protein arginine kinase activator